MNTCFKIQQNIGALIEEIDGLKMDAIATRPKHYFFFNSKRRTRLINDSMRRIERDIGERIGYKKDLKVTIIISSTTFFSKTIMFYGVRSIPQVLKQLKQLSGWDISKKDIHSLGVRAQNPKIDHITEGYERPLNYKFTRYDTEVVIHTYGYSGNTRFLK